MAFGKHNLEPQIVEEETDEENTEETDVVEKIENDDEKNIENIEKSTEGISIQEGVAETNEDDEEEFEEVGYDDRDMPISYQATLKQHSRLVNTIHIDPAGSRMVTGGLDHEMRLWDFNSMDDTFRSFRTIKPFEGYGIVDAKFSLTGDRILVASSCQSAKMCDRDGHTICDYSKGDPYLRDKKNTKGHTHAIMAADWHPFDGNTFITSGMDSTVRIWDVENDKSQKSIIVIKGKAAKRPAVSAVAYKNDASVIASGSDDGTIRLWNAKGPFVVPIKNKMAHEADKYITSLSFSLDGNLLLSRSWDNTLKVWDMRNFNDPLFKYENLPNVFEKTCAMFSPDNKLFMTGTSAKKGSGESGRVIAYETTTGQVLNNIDLADGSVVKLYWHKRLNQIFAGSSGGSVAALYDKERSHKGVLCCVKRHFTSKIESFVSADKKVYAPNSLPLFKEQTPYSLKEKRAQERYNYAKSKRPELPNEAKTKGSKLGDAYTQHLVQMLRKEAYGDESDPRAALMKYAKMAEENPEFVAHAYKRTQPVALFETGEYTEFEVKRHKPE
ncbi:hypothetical protein O9G_004217 [Rozella allomycis CSF55]|uniref:Uncharacterized protein n=1 Tax=Rozella allomycis (strain CSF55) TaxID=988480 RepID=A0A075AU48_ROZAC|nr:hypothetical protein O9G_004217 [Rozella allomycis CSF55]|eukprot:EPZ32242.1 hypothetical protein O9G_004217 [Rozella allomycis CSF55]